MVKETMAKLTLTKALGSNNTSNEEAASCYFKNFNINNSNHFFFLKNTLFDV